MTEIMYHLPDLWEGEGISTTSSLHKLWQEIYSTLQNAQNSDDITQFQGAFLTCITFGCKLRWRSSSLEGLQRSVRDLLLGQLFNDQYIVYNEVWSCAAAWFRVRPPGTGDVGGSPSPKAPRKPKHSGVESARGMGITHTCHSIA